MKIRHALSVFALCALMPFAPAVGGTHAPLWLDDADALATVINNDGAEIGQAYVKQGTEGVLLYIAVHSLPSGALGLHFHEVGDCSDHDAFMEAGGHIMPSGKPHGFLHPEGPHEGNLPNLIVHDDGTARVEMYTQLVHVTDGDAALLGGNGATLMIHEHVDDHYSQPIGNAGGRIGCGVFVAPGADKPHHHGHHHDQDYSR